MSLTSLLRREGLSSGENGVMYPYKAFLAIALALYGLYAAAHIPTTLIEPAVLLPLVAAFLFQAICAFAGAVGVWRARPWAPVAIVLLGAVIALTALVEAIMGLVAYLNALLVAVLALVIAVLLASSLRGRL